jgi:hypothetical protein
MDLHARTEVGLRQLFVSESSPALLHPSESSAVAFSLRRLARNWGAASCSTGARATSSAPTASMTQELGGGELFDRGGALARLISTG